MAYLEGKTVKEKIKARPLKLEEALDIAIQTAQGLQAAHEKGIVHRDINSANLMVTRLGPHPFLRLGLQRENRLEVSRDPRHQRRRTGKPGVQRRLRP